VELRGRTSAAESQAQHEAAACPYAGIGRDQQGLKGRGFRFVGSTIVYAYMQAVGMVNDIWRLFSTRAAGGSPKTRFFG